MEGFLARPIAVGRWTPLASFSALSGAPASLSSSSSSYSSSPVAGTVCPFSRTLIIKAEQRHTPVKRLRWVLPLAAAGLLNVAVASVANADTTGSFVEGILSQEPTNALSLPTWTIHVASVVEWIVAMGLVWRFGDYPENAAWKGLAWGMVPLLGGAMCACTWHFFYNAESLEILVVLQAALTVIGNFTMWIAAYRIYQSSSKSI